MEINPKKTKILKSTYFDKRTGKRRRKWTDKILKGGSLPLTFNAELEMKLLGSDLSEVTGFKEPKTKKRKACFSSDKWKNTRVRSSIWTVKKR